MMRDKKATFCLTAALFFTAAAVMGCADKTVALEEIGAGEAQQAQSEPAQLEPAVREREAAEGDMIPGQAAPEENAQALASAGVSRPAKAGKEPIYVYVCGEVLRPDVYEASDGDRLFKLIEMAGGFTGEADQSALNLAEKAKDGQQVYVPSREEVLEFGTDGPWAQSEKSPGQEAKTAGKININRASEEELTALPGIGAAKAKSILAYREESGGFNAIEEIKNVKGIGDAMFESIRDLITAE